jgi:hypothetical protein
VSQRESVLAALRTAGSRGICLADVPLEVSYTLRNRVSELRRQGTDVRSELCRVHAHDGPISRYTLHESLVQLADRRPGNAPAARGGKKLRVSLGDGRVPGAYGSQTGELPVVGGLDRAAQEVLAL